MEQVYVHYKEVMEEDNQLNEDMELETQLKEAASKRALIQARTELHGTVGTTSVKAELKHWKYLNQSIMD
jgi:hypothetical protein